MPRNGAGVLLLVQAAGLDSSRRSALVVLEQPAQPVAADDFAHRGLVASRVLRRAPLTGTFPSPWCGRSSW